jgi:hypothetical protein
MKLYSASITETGGKRLVEMTFTDGSPPDESDELLVLRVPVETRKDPRLPEACLKALVHARNVIGDETQRLGQIRNQDYPNEDWR